MGYALAGTPEAGVSPTAVESAIVTATTVSTVAKRPNLRVVGDDRPGHRCLQTVAPTGSTGDRHGSSELALWVDMPVDPWSEANFMREATRFRREIHLYGMSGSGEPAQSGPEVSRFCEATQIETRGMWLGAAAHRG